MIRGLVVDPRKLALRVVVAEQCIELVHDGECALRLAICGGGIGCVYIEGEVGPHRGMHASEELLRCALPWYDDGRECQSDSSDFR